MRAGAPRSHDGIALVLVLAFVALLSAVVLALLLSARTQVAAASYYQTDVQLKHLAASATGLVTGQLLDATHSTTGANVSPSRVTWASQPGLIRTWDDTGKGWRIFKLYSAR